jgi:hypothetical protein
MAGLIVNPISWAKGKIATAEWFQQIQDNVNSLYGGTGAGARYFWVHSTAWRQLISADWTPTNSGLSWQAVSTTGLVAPIAMGGSTDAAYNVISEIQLTVTTAGAVPLTLYLMSTATTTGPTFTTSVLSGATSTTPGVQKITLTTAISISSAMAYALRVIPGQAGDLVYGARLKVG